MKPLKRFAMLDKKVHNRQLFDCTKKPLNEFLQRQAAKHQELGISATYVLPASGSANNKRIISYYTLTTDTITRHSLPTALAKKLPYYPIPVIVIARLAVDKTCVGQGFGAITLVKAIRHCVNLSVDLPAFAIVVDAKDKSARDFYLQFGFKDLEATPGDQTRLFLPLKLAKLV